MGANGKLPYFLLHFPLSPSHFSHSLPPHNCFSLPWPPRLHPPPLLTYPSHLNQYCQHQPVRILGTLLRQMKLTISAWSATNKVLIKILRCLCFLFVYVFGPDKTVCPLSMILDAIYFNFVLPHLVNGTQFNPLVLSSTWTHGHLCQSACLHGPHSLNRWKGPLSGLHCVYTWCWMSIRVLHCTLHRTLRACFVGFGTFPGKPNISVASSGQKVINWNCYDKKIHLCHLLMSQRREQCHKKKISFVLTHAPIICASTRPSSCFFFVITVPWPALLISLVSHLYKLLP